MKIIKNVTVELSEKDLKQIIAEHMKNEGFDALPENVSFNVGTRLTGCYRDEHEETYLKGCTVNCVMK